MNRSVLGILVGGGPAPGINGVISAATIEAINNGMEVLGIFDGFQWLIDAHFNLEQHTTPLSIASVSRIHFRGGSILRAARQSLLDESRLDESDKVEADHPRVAHVVANLRRCGITHLITIGGDDTALSARFIAEAAGDTLRVVHVPKTIDNDLPLPGDISTFGFATARHLGSTIVANLMEDAKTTSRWYLVVTMGRKAGFLALGIGKAAGATLSLIPEEFPPRTTIAQIADVIEGAIIKRQSMGRPDGVVIVAEGLAYRLGDRDELERLLGREVPVDAAGHPRLSEVPLSSLLKDELTRRCKQRGIRTTIIGQTLGYELRCAAPTPFDMGYCRDLGFGAVRLLLENHRAHPPGVMVIYQDGNLRPLDFAHMIDPQTRRTLIRQVHVESDSYRVARAYMVRLERADLENHDRLSRLAAAARLTPEAFRERFRSAVYNLDDGTRASASAAVP